jgi:hypothetical membrane protein
MPSSIFSSLVMAGTGVVVLAIVYAALGYRGKRSERFSLLNHFISELGEVGVSRGARVFNGGLILGGLLLVPFVIRLGVTLGSALGWIGAVFGVVASLGVTAVGVFPMNNLKPHGHAAMTFFRGGLVMVLAFGLAILFQPVEGVVVPRAASLLSLLAVLAFSSFLLLPRIKKPDMDPVDTLDPEMIPERPRFWALSFLEWLVFFATILWLFGMAFFV